MPVLALLPDQKHKILWGFASKPPLRGLQQPPDPHFFVTVMPLAHVFCFAKNPCTQMFSVFPTGTLRVEISIISIDSNITDTIIRKVINV